MKEQQCILCGSGKKQVISHQKFEDDYLQLINPEYNPGLILCGDQ